MNPPVKDDGSRKYVTLGEYEEKREGAKKKIAAKIKK